ncbi:UNVERIFIED_CONTAM: hypothetical protein HDU68_001585 [Siphonaria sp. JEL0065]|nr:hypothetical protein HDU68_001585 [Siphonaria sp. JEL0065]
MVPAVIKQFQFAVANEDAYLEQKEREETARITKQRAILRLFTEDVVGHNVDAEFEAEFDKEFSKMIQDRLESRKFVKKAHAVFNVAIPVKRAFKKLVLSYDDRADDDENSAAAPQKPTVKGKKQVLYSNDRQKQHHPKVIPKSLFE